MAELYQGRRMHDGTCEILADGKALSLARSCKVINHSPTGFEWGYGGSGPAQSALAILLDFTGWKRDFCERFHQDFKFKVIAGQPKEGWTITGDFIRGWIAVVKATEEARGRTLCGKCLCAIYLHSGEGRCWSKGCDCGKKTKSESHRDLPGDRLGQDAGAI